MRIDGFSPANILRTIAGSGEAGPLVSGRTLLIGAGVAALGIAAVVGWKLLHNDAGSGDGGSGGSGGGQNVGVAHGYKQHDRPDGTGSWDATDGAMLLNRHLGQAGGYATLAEAITAAHPNAPDTDDMAFVRTADGKVDAWTVKADGLDRLQSFEGTDATVVAYTSPESGNVFAGPAATADEVATDHLTRRAVPDMIINRWIA